MASRASRITAIVLGLAALAVFAAASISSEPPLSGKPTTLSERPLSGVYVPELHHFYGPVATGTEPTPGLMEDDVSGGIVRLADLAGQ